MGASPIRRRGANRALGNLGRTTLGDQAVGGGHDEILRRLAGQGGNGWERRRSINTFAGLDDVRVDYEDEESEFLPTAGDVPVWDATIDTPFGGAWRAGSAAGAASEMFVASDSGSFDEASGYFNFQPQVPVDPQQWQVVEINALVTADTGIFIPVDGDPVNGTVAMPTPLFLSAYDATGDPLATRIAYQDTTGSGRAQCHLWVWNDTDARADHVISASVDATSLAISYSFDVTATITVRTIHAPGA